MRGIHLSYSLPFEEFQEIWSQEAEISIDTNGLLNAYRFSPSVTEEVLAVFNQIIDRIWIPAQVVEEFERNHENVVNKQRNKYREVKKEVDRIIEKAKNDYEKQFFKFGKFRFPQVTDLGKFIEESLESIQSKSRNYEELITEEIKNNKKMLNEDKIQLFLESLVERNQVGEQFSIADLIRIYSEGEERYKYQIPPGYKDIDKDKTDPTKRQKFGDLILWKQLLHRANITEKPMILITLDEKEDWWVLDSSNNPVKPRPELLKEYQEQKNQKIVLLSLTQFVNLISQMNEISIANRTKIELSADDYTSDLMASIDWLEKIQASDLESFLINNGELQEFLDFSLLDVEVFGANDPVITISSVEINEEGTQVSFEGEFESVIHANIDQEVYRDFTINFETFIAVRGSINFTFNTDFSQEDEFIDVNSLELVIGGFEVIETDIEDEFESIIDDNELCGECNKRPGAYFKNTGEPVCESCSINYETCPECGRLFPSGELGGAFCYDCEKKRDN